MINKKFVTYVLFGFAIVMVFTGMVSAEEKMENKDKKELDKKVKKQRISKKAKTSISATVNPTYFLDVYVSYNKPSGTLTMYVYASSTASASENIDYIEASGIVTSDVGLAPEETIFTYGPVGNYNDDLAVASGTGTTKCDPLFGTTVTNYGHGKYIISGVTYYLDAKATVTCP